MKKIITVALTLLLNLVLLVSLSLLTGCSMPSSSSSSSAQQLASADSGENSSQLSVITTCFAPYDFARTIAANKAEVNMLLPPGAELHSFEPTPQDIIAIQKCDVFVYVGGESDEWVEEVLASMDTSSMTVITLMDCVELVEEEIVEGMEEEEEEEEEDVAYDEHVWTSPHNAKLIVEKISDALQKADTKNAATYKSNTTAYLSQLDELDAAFKTVVNNATRKTLVFGDRFPLRYFADTYHLDYYAAFPGCSTETECSAATIAFLVTKVHEENIPVVFKIELSNGNIAQSIAGETGAKVLTFNSCHNITKTDFDAGKTYLDLMHENIEPLKKALS